MLASHSRGGAFSNFATMSATLHPRRSSHRRSTTVIGNRSRSMSLNDIEIARHFFAVSRHEFNVS
jgi:hypothetical protein